MKQDAISTNHSFSTGRASGLSRRNFIVGSAAAGLSALHWPAGAQTRLRVGLVGCGGAGRSITNAIAGEDLGMDILAVCDSDPEATQAVARSVAVNCSTDWRALLQDDQIDAMIIATPDCLHGPMALAAVDAGKHVFLMPPLAMHSEDALTLRKRAEEHRLVVQTGLTFGSDALWAEASTHLRARGPGLRHIHVVCPASPVAATWQGTRGQSLGPAALAIFEALYPLHYHLNLGAPERISAMGGILDAGNRETLDSLTVTLRYPGGLTAVLTSSPTPATRPSITLRGAWSAIELEGAAAGVSRYDLPAELKIFAQAVRKQTPDSRMRLDAACTAQLALCSGVDTVGRTALS